MAKYTTEQIIEKFRSMHGDLYDYSLVEYKHSHTKMKIKCGRHGIFETNTHQYGSGCPTCHIESRRLSPEEFILKSEKTHKGRYDYSDLNYVSSDKKINIGCYVHGIFHQYPYDHINGFGCPRCSNKEKLTTAEFIQRSRDTHGERYDYTNSNYISSHKKIKIICSHHGMFEQVAHDHMIGRGCFKCREIRGGYSSTFFENYPEEKTKNALLYLAKIKNDSEIMIKIGITTKTFEERYNKGEYSNMTIELLESVKLPLFSAFTTEQHLLVKYKHDRFYTNREKFGGHTECLRCKENIIEEIKSSFQSLGI